MSPSDTGGVQEFFQAQSKVCIYNINDDMNLFINHGVPCVKLSRTFKRVFLKILFSEIAEIISE